MLSIIIVSWNTCEFLDRCLVSIETEVQRNELEVEVIVVDNNSHDGTQKMIRETHPQVRLIESEQNLGFSAGNNIGLAEAHGKWLMLLNPDTEVVGDALSELIRFLQAHPAVGLVGPALFYEDGTQQVSRHRFPSLFSLFIASTPLYSLFSSFLKGYYMTNEPLTQSMPVDWLSGAALVLRRDVYKNVGGLDDTFFMYFEETDWQRRIKAAGWPIWYFPDATIRHYEDASSSQVVALRHIRFNRSRIQYAKKWHGRGIATLLRGWLLLLFAIEWLKEGSKWLVGHKRALREQRMKEYRQVLVSGL